MSFKNLVWICVAVGIMTVILSDVSDADESDILTYSIAGDTATVTGMNTDGGHLDIPSAVYVDGKEYTVTAIGNNAFRDCTSLTSVTIPDGVTSIGDFAFYGCTSLTSMTIPDSVTSIGWAAFQSCSSLTYVYLPSVDSIGSLAYYGCTDLSLIVTGKSPTIGDYAIPSKTNIIQGVVDDSVLSIADTVTRIGMGAFNGSSYSVINIPSSVTSIGSYAFIDCAGLTAINVDSDNPNYSSIDGVLFNKDQTILIQYPAGKSADMYMIPDTVTAIGKGAFFGCNLTSIGYSDGIAVIGDNAFFGCTGIAVATIPSSVTEIGRYAYQNCTNLALVVINGSPVIGKDAFKGAGVDRIINLGSTQIEGGMYGLSDNVVTSVEGYTTVDTADTSTEEATDLNVGVIILFGMLFLLTGVIAVMQIRNMS